MSSCDNGSFGNQRRHIGEQPSLSPHDNGVRTHVCELVENRFSTQMALLTRVLCDVTKSILGIPIAQRTV